MLKLKRLIVIALVRACDVQDWLRLDYLTHSHRLAHWSSLLDERWETNVWRVGTVVSNRFDNMMDCPYCHREIALGTLIGVEIAGVFPGVLFWQCPHCDGRWHRWVEGSALAKAADPHVTPYARKVR